MCKVKSPAKYKHIKLWKRNIKAKVDGVSCEEVLKLIPRDIMVDFKDSQYAIDKGSNDDITDISLMSCNSDNDPNILHDILLELKKCGRKDIWKVISPRMLFKYYLADAEAIASSFIHAELNCINRVFKETTGQYLFKTNVNKNTKVNKICAKFGDMSEVHQQQSTSYRNLKSLHNMALKIVSSGDVPKPVIAVSIARIKYTLDYPTWITKFTTPSEIFINHRNETFKCFSFPEYSEKRNQIEARTLDPTHLMTNLRAHACRKGFQFFNNESFIRVSDVNKNLLSKAMIKHVLDQQNAEIAKCIFSKEVESIMLKNGNTNEAKFIKLVWDWYEACDERGIHPNKRVNRWINMHNFLLTNVDFCDFPPPGTHIKGIPIVTYEGILQGITTRILLYNLSHKKTFNNRLISTLGIESFFHLCQKQI